MSKASAEIIVLSDEEDEVQIESVITAKQPLKHSNQPSPSRTPILLLTEPRSISYGIERGYRLKSIHGLKRLPMSNMLMYLVEYVSCDDYEFVPADILRRYCDENLLIEYLEKLTTFHS